MKKTLFWFGLAAAVGAAIAFVAGQRRRLAAMSDDEIRLLLSDKLTGRVPDERLAEIQEAVIASVRGRRASPPGAGEVSGTVAYRERIAMPEDAVVIVTLEDTSRMDVPADQIGVQVIENPGSVPVPYSVAYDPAEIDDTHSYAVRATITSGDQLLWTTDTHYPVITRGNPRTADLLVVKVPVPR